MLSEQIQQNSFLQEEDQEWDVVVIGAGILGTKLPLGPLAGCHLCLGILYRNSHYLVPQLSLSCTATLIILYRNSHIIFKYFFLTFSCLGSAAAFSLGSQGRSVLLVGTGQQLTIQQLTILIIWI